MVNTEQFVILKTMIYSIFDFINYFIIITNLAIRFRGLFRANQKFPLMFTLCNRLGIKIDEFIYHKNLKKN
jgi:hypothetical protein